MYQNYLYAHSRCAGTELVFFRLCDHVQVTERIRDYGVRGRGRGGFGYPQRPFHGPGGTSGEGAGAPSSSRHEPIPSFNEKFGMLCICMDPEAYMSVVAKLTGVETHPSASEKMLQK